MIHVFLTVFVTKQTARIWVFLALKPCPHSTTISEKIQKLLLLPCYHNWRKQSWFITHLFKYFSIQLRPRSTRGKSFSYSATIMNVLYSTEKQSTIWYYSPKACTQLSKARNLKAMNLCVRQRGIFDRISLTCPNTDWGPWIPVLYTVFRVHELQQSIQQLRSMSYRTVFGVQASHHSIHCLGFMSSSPVYSIWSQ